MLSHQNALTFVEWCAEEFQVRSEDRLSNHAPLHFDLSVFDVYNTLEAGATVYLITEDLAVFPTSLANFIETQGITIWYSVPSALMLLLLHGRLTADKAEESAHHSVCGRSLPDEVSAAVGGSFAEHRTL